MSEFGAPSAAIWGKNGVIARPALRVSRTPVPDPAYATFHSNVAAVTRHFKASGVRSSYSRLRLALPLYLGSPLLFSAKAAIDGLVAGGLFVDDSAEYLREIRAWRTNPRLEPWTVIWPMTHDAEETGDCLQIPGVPAPPVYTPVNTKPVLDSEHRSPARYRQSCEELASEIHLDEHGIELLRTPSCGFGLDISVCSQSVVDLDNVGLSVLDQVELLRPAERNGYLLDEQAGWIRIRVCPQPGPDSVEFSVFQPQGDNRLGERA